ncbi:MAG: chemotaxis protein CheC [Coxiellaceae bacterium]|nr:chemotaxis protein CheC [Coxiellaceae bacterium]
MIMNDQLRDSLTEVCNVGTSRAASQLSILLKDNILVEVPTVTLSTLENLPKILGKDESQVFVAVSQNMTGCFKGEAILLFTNADCKVLVESVLQGFGGMDTPQADIYKQESMIEIGNIIVSASISSLADMLKSEVLLTVPTYHEYSLRELLSKNEKKDLPIVAIITQLNADHERVSGMLLYLFESESIDVLLEMVAELGRGNAS